MASLPRRLLLQSRQCPSRIRAVAAPRPAAQWQRPLSTTPRRCADAKNEDREAAMLAALSKDLAALDPEVVADAIRKGKQGIPIGKDYQLETDEDFDIEEDDRRKTMSGFWAEGEESMGPDEDYYADDITSHGHGELQKHRELREYARLIAWELPLLSHLAQPFVPPTPATPFRFRYTSYLAESHPAANKVVVEFSPPDLSLPAPATAKLIKLAGPRYNPSTQVVKLSCEQFDTQAQNKRFLGETIQALVTAAKDSTDSFEDVPFDFRHHKEKKYFAFPKEWVLTEQRKAYLEEKRRADAISEDERLNNGRLVDGKVVIETSLPFLEQAAVEEPVMVGAGRKR